MGSIIIKPIPNSRGIQARDFHLNHITCAENWHKIRNQFQSFNVLDYGAKGGGVTNDTAAFLAASIAAYNAQGSVFIPDGDYNLVGLDLSSYPCAWVGNSPRTTRLLLHSDTADMITMAPAVESIGWSFTNLQFRSAFLYSKTGGAAFVPGDIGKAVVGASSGQSGILINYNNSDGTFTVDGGAVYTIGESISVTAGTGTGTILTNMATTRRAFKCTRVALSNWTNCWIDGFYAGIDFFLDCNTSVLDHVVFGSANQFGVRLSSAGTTTNIGFTGCFFEENLQRGVYCNSSSTVYSACRFDANSFAAMLLDASAQRNLITGCQFRKGGGPIGQLGIDVYGSYNVFADNIIDQFSGGQDVIVRAGATENAFMWNQTARAGWLADSGTNTIRAEQTLNRYSLGVADDGVSGFKAKGPWALPRPANTQGKNGGLVLEDQISQAKGVLALEGLTTNDVQLLAAAAIRFYTNSDLVSTGEVGRWLANGRLLIGTTTDGGQLLQVAGTVASTDTTNATSATTGSVITAGGMGIAKALWVAGLANIAGALTGQSSIKSTSPTAGIGYDTGAGGTVTQATDKTTGVTLSKVSGQITMNAAALAADTAASFTLTNTAIAAADILAMNHVSGGTAGAYTLNAQCAAGSAVITVRNVTAGSLSEAIVIGFVLIKGVTA